MARGRSPSPPPAVASRPAGKGKGKGKEGKGSGPLGTSCFFVGQKMASLCQEWGCRNPACGMDGTEANDRDRSRSPRRGNSEPTPGPSATPDDDTRMASDLESGFVFCPSAAAGRQAMEDGETRLEFVGLVDQPDERARCLDLVCELLGGDAPRLVGVSFAGCGLSPSELRRLAGALGTQSKIDALGVSKNVAPTSVPASAHDAAAADLESAWKALFAALPAEVTWFDFGDNLLGDALTASLISTLAGRESLQKLYLDGNKLSELSGLAAALPDTGITDLDLGDNQIGSLEKLVEVLPESLVMILVLGKNPISASDISKLLDVLPRTQLDALYLDNTDADDECLKVLGDVIKGTNLSELHLDTTKITDAGVRALIPFVGESGLTYLDVSGNGVSEETTAALEEVVVESDNEEAEEENEKEDE